MHSEVNFPRQKQFKFSVQLNVYKKIVPEALILILPTP